MTIAAEVAFGGGGGVVKNVWECYNEGQYGLEFCLDYMIHPTHFLAAYKRKTYIELISAFPWIKQIKPNT